MKHKQTRTLTSAFIRVTKYRLPGGVGLEQPVKNAGKDTSCHRLQSYLWLLCLWKLGGLLELPNSQPAKTGSFPFGIEKVNLYLKQKSKVFVVSPGNFYTFERKRNQMTILPDLNYNYQVCIVWYWMVLHTISCNNMQYDESPYP